MKRLFHFLLGSTAAIAAALGLLFIWLSLTYVSAADLPPLKTGDIVFQEAGGSQAMAISFASKSAYTHTGIVEIKDGRAYVVEAVGPVKTTPLDRWIEHGTGGRITVKRVKNLDDIAAQKAVTAAHAHDGKPYDMFFYKGRDAIYCSELVHIAFEEGPGLTIGKQERIRDLNIDNAAVRTLIKERWERYPGCIAAKAKTFEVCYEIILDETLVTPASVARDPKLDTVFTNFGPVGD